MAAVGELQWSGRLVGCQRALAKLEADSRRGSPAEMLRAAESLADNATTLVAWLKVSIDAGTA